MALTIEAPNPEKLALPEFIEALSDSTDMGDDAQLARAASALRGLANDRSVIVNAVNDELRSLTNTATFQQDNDYSAQTILLGRGPGFLVRANIWLPDEATRAGRDSTRLLGAYELPHDHDYSFLTIGYWGPGYATSIWEYDRERLIGQVGERVDLRFLEHTTLPEGKIMFYRACRDVHAQEYPADLSVSLNLLFTPPEGSRAQYTFDIDTSTVSGVVANSAALRTSFCRLAPQVGNDETAEILDRLAWTYPEPRLRWVACESLVSLVPVVAEQVLRRAADDPDVYVRWRARGVMEDGRAQ